MQVDIGLCQIVSAGQPMTVLVLAEMVEFLVPVLHHQKIKAMEDNKEEVVVHCLNCQAVASNQELGPQIEASPYL
jgi:hypothetical protein